MPTINKNGKTYEVSRTVELAEQCKADSEAWFPDVAHSIVHHTLGLAGETGEFADWIKKCDRGTANINDAGTRYKVIMELTDVYIYVLNLAALLGVDLEQAYAAKRTENLQRFGKKVNGNG